MTNMNKKSTKDHPGFAKVQDQIAKREGVSEAAAGAILASSSRGASKAAKKANPRLKRVKGKNPFRKAADGDRDD